jgi:hypothetical protein
MYMAIGSLVTVIVLVVAAIQIPKFFSTKAQGTQQQLQDPGYRPAVELSQVPNSSTPPVQAPPTASPAASTPVSAEPPPQHSQSAPPRTVASPAQTPVQQPAQHAAQTPPATPAQNPPVSAPASTPAQVVQRPPEPEPAKPAAQPAVDTAELENLRDSLMKLGARAGAVQAKAKRIEQDQRAQGLGMRSDVVSGLGRMSYYMDEAENALKAGNAASAKAALQRADRETSTLERILGI